MNQSKREPYQPPVVQRIRFASGELAVGSCKKQTKPGSTSCFNGNVNLGPRVGS